METWFIIVVSLCIAALIRSTLLHRRTPTTKPPPGPSLLHSSFLLLTNPSTKFEPVLINLKARFGPIFTLSTGLGPSIFVSNHSLTHQLLVKKGSMFSDRPNISINFNISTALYGPTWRLLRRNLASEIMQPNRIRSYSSGRKWALGILISRVLERQDDEEGVMLVDHFRDVVFRLLVLMCFGDKLDEVRVEEIARVQREMLKVVGSGRFSMLTMFPRVGKMLFRNVWKKFEISRVEKERVLVPIIKSRMESDCFEDGIVAYVDTFANLRVYENEDGNGRKLSYREMVGLCGEFLTGGTDTTASALQWIMANLVKHSDIQTKLYDEIVAVVGPPPRRPRIGVEMEADAVINEEDLKKMRYLKAVVLEGLRRHPPSHFVIPHKVIKDVEVEGCMFPQGAIINFMVNEMGLDPNVWDEPMEFKPERFLVNDDVFDVSGRKGIKMMPFGAGRRICPGSDLAMLHLEYFVANLIWYFDWSVADGYHVDLSEKIEMVMFMKNPLRARITYRAED